MNLTQRVVMRRLSETYGGKNEWRRGEEIRTTSFERKYLEGIATDKLPSEKYAKAGYAVKLGWPGRRTSASTDMRSGS